MIRYETADETDGTQRYEKKVDLKEGVSISVMQEMQYDLNLMKANAMLMINPQPDGFGEN